MVSQKMQDSINNQINAEIYSAYLYFSMATYFDDLNLPGFANWMKVQAQEEMYHAIKFQDFLNERGGRVLLKAIEGPPTEWKNSLDVFKNVYEHECHVTQLINGLVKVAKEENDNASEIFLQWYVTEQVEEEANADDLVKKLEMIGDNTFGVFMLDKELQGRTYTAPADTAE